MARNRSTYAFVKGAIAASAFLCTTVAAHADISTFATFSSIDQTKNVSLVNSGTSGLTNATLYSTSSEDASQPGAVLVKFGFLQDGLSDFVTNVVAEFSLNGTITDAAATPGVFLYQPVFSGTMSFISTTAITVRGPLFELKTFAAGSNLLTINFSGS
ncbi:MAG: hypothetical protein EOO77_31875, partial [Oxalobacteraceae bacterium]